VDEVGEGTEGPAEAAEGVLSMGTEGAFEGAEGVRRLDEGVDAATGLVLER